MSKAGSHIFRKNGRQIAGRQAGKQAGGDRNLALRQTGTCLYRQKGREAGVDSCRVKTGKEDCREGKRVAYHASMQ